MASSRAIDFAIERQRHAGFVGRAALLARLDQLVIADRTDRWVVLTGGPGMGKSAVLAAWLARREAAGEVVPHHFIRRGWANWDDPEALVRSLVAQIEARVPELGEPEVDEQLAPAARLAAVLLRASERVLVPRGERLVLLIDGLDEYDPRPGSPPGDPLAAFLPYALPPGVSVLCASRPRHPYLDKLAMRGALVKIDLDDAPGFAADNTATVRAFWDQAAPALGLDAAFIDEAVTRAAGNPQHAVMLRQQLAGLPPEQREVEDIPLGLDASIASAWERIATDPLVVHGLGILCAARDALTLDELGRVAGLTSEPQRRTFLGRARELLIETRRTSRVSEYRLHHDSIRAYIAEAIGSDALAAHHLALAEQLATWPAHADAAARRYALNRALLHRAEAGVWADAWRVAADLAFLEAKCRELGAHDAEADVGRTATRCRASGDDAQGDRFADLARALGRESHWLRAAPEATAVLLWNRLRRMGWSEGDLDARIRVPDGSEFLRLRYAATRESPALVRNLAGHDHAVTACAVTPDGRHVVSASLDKTLKIWELASGLLVATLKGHTSYVTACAVTPDGRHVVSASDDDTLKVWELASGLQVAMLQGHTSRVTACTVTPDGQHVVSASEDHTLKIWELASGLQVAMLQGHTSRVTACTVTPNGRYVVSASNDHTLKFWDLATYACRRTHHGDTGYHAVAVTATTIIAGDMAGGVWFFDWPWPWSKHPLRVGHDGSNEGHRLTPAPVRSPSPRSPMKHTILYVAANPLNTDRLALDEECAAIERELRMTSGRDDFDFRSKWAVSVDELMRHLNELQPTVLHFSGHGSTDGASSSVRSGDPQRDITGTRSAGILLQDGRSRQHVSDRALAKMIASAAPSTRVVVLNACYSAGVADSLRHEVDCVVGIDDATADTAARSFAVAFYRALGHRRSIGNAVDQAAATLEAKHPGARPVCATRDGLRADQMFLPAVGGSASSGEPVGADPR